MKNRKKIAVSVGTSAFNEANNIKNMLVSVLAQKEKNFVLKEILVVSDGSSDNTVAIAQSIKDKRIKIFNDRKRFGQPSRIAQMLKTFKGDVFILIDSDMVMKNNLTIEKMVSKFRSDAETALVCGETYPLTPRTFLEKAINNYRYARTYLEHKNIFDFGKTAYSAHAFLAYSKKFARGLSIPHNVLNPDAFSYFACITNGYKQHYENRAVALYSSPQNLKDHINQSIRHLAGGVQLYDYFGKKSVDAGFTVPSKIMIKIMLYQLRKNPLGYIFLKILNLYCGYKSRKGSKNLDIKWTTITSSKMSVL